MICLTLSGSTLSACLSEIRENREYIDLAELRLDYLEKGEQKRASEFPSMTDVPVILTLRRKEDGGKCTLSEKERRALLLSALDGDFAYVDIEEDVKKNDVEEKARAKGVKIIRSFHDFSGIPDDIYESAAEQRYVYSSGSTVDYFGEKVDEAEIVGVLFRAYGEETVDYSIVNGEFFLNHSGDAVFISLDGDSLTLSMEGKDNLVFTRM